MSKVDNLEQELFDMVYQWGRVGVVTGAHAPAFQSLIKQFVPVKDLLAEIDFQNHADGDVCDRYNQIDNGGPNNFAPPLGCNCWKNALIHNLKLKPPLPQGADK